MSETINHGTNPLNSLTSIEEGITAYLGDWIDHFDVAAIVEDYIATINAELEDEGYGAYYITAHSLYGPADASIEEIDELPLHEIAENVDLGAICEQHEQNDDE